MTHTFRYWPRLFLLCAIAAISLTSAQAAPQTLLVSIAETLALPEAKALAGSGFLFSWGTLSSPKLTQRKGRDFSSGDESARNSSPQAACQQAFLSALDTLVEEARERKANTIYSIESFYEGEYTDSSKEFRCTLNGSSAYVFLHALFGSQD